jgi:hypothetical protein
MCNELDQQVRQVAQRSAKRQGHAESRRLLAAALERIPPQLEAPSERSEQGESPESGEEAQGVT